MLTEYSIPEARHLAERTKQNVPAHSFEVVERTVKDIYARMDHPVRFGEFKLQYDISSLNETEQRLLREVLYGKGYETTRAPHNPREVIISW